ncbi:Ger(x)C family germination protein [Cytobacillus firmus]|uniref:Ger(X)C family germination protein n=2 Tax=Cytobacillus TaxID=2675230 RepID=A0A366K332_CYTFI|nr:MULTISPECIES: Ger(x)C family spore germination protein [Cytobacillus]RBP96169.1 Ger(x)C family germination protein [Cytobacillus firmus]TDX45082.1 Ger(x)C family germination protein [Cytobacillus oceanisediminis]
MKRWFLVILFLFLAAILSSCGRSIPLEDLAISLILGVDLDEEDNLIISESSPVFNSEAKKKIETYELEAKTIRDSRRHFDALTPGAVTAGKIQVLLIGKRVLEHEDWFNVLDTIYRNPTFSVNSRIIVVDGPVSDVIHYEPEDKPQLPLFLKEVIDKNIDRSRTVLATPQSLHRQMYEKGMTPLISELKKGQDVEIVGVSLMDQYGKYVDTLGMQETSLLIILKDKQTEELTISIPLPELGDEGGIFNKNELSIDLSRIKSKVKTTYNQDKFHFNYKIHMTASIVEQLFTSGNVKENELEKMIEQELKSRFEGLIKKIQKNKIDPIGLGIYARAYQYEQYKKVEGHWGEALADSNIDVSVDVTIKSTGAIR